MSEQLVLNVQSRTASGSVASRRLRRSGLAPAVVTGHGASQAVTLDAAAFLKQVPPERFGSQMVQLQIDGHPVGLALVKSVQINTFTRTLLAVELQRVSIDEDVQVSVPVSLTGEAADVRRGGVLEQLTHTVTLRCRVSDVPAALQYDVSAMTIGDSLHAGQLALPMACALVTNPDELIATLAPPTVPVLEEPMGVSEVSGPDLTGDKQKDDTRLAS